MAQTDESYGRVDADGTVHVREGDVWRLVGSYPDATSDEALAYFQRKYADIESRVSLAEQRVKAGSPAKDVQSQVAGLQKDLTEPAAVGDIESLRARLAALGSALGDLKTEQAKESEAVVTEAVAHREKIVADIEALAATDPSKIRWKTTTATITELFESWQNHQQTGPRLPKKVADSLWSRFRAARTTLEKARRSYFHELDTQSKEAKGAKRELIEKAQALAPKGAEGISAYRALLEKWKQAPRASRSVEDALWASFKAAGDALYEQKALQEQQDDDHNAGNLEAKKTLLAEFHNILELGDRDTATARLRVFHDRFAAIGPVPKKLSRSVDDQAKKFDQHVRKLDEDFWAKNDPEKQARSQSMADQLERAIAQLEVQLTDVTEPQKQAIEEELATKKAWLAIVDR
jgi:hypothetical protein